MRDPWTTKRSNQSVLKEINPEYSLEGLMLKLKFQYFDQLMRRPDSLEKTLLLGKIDGGKVETVTDLTFLGSKSTVDGDCSHEIKRHLLLARKALTNFDNILKSRHITLLTKICIIKVIVFPVVMYGYESWTIKKAEHRRTDALESPLDYKEIKPVSPKGNQP